MIVATILYSFSQTQNHVFLEFQRIETFQKFQTLHLNFSIFIEGPSNLNCLQGRVGKSL